MHQTLFHDEKLNNQRLEWSFLNVVKVTYEDPIANLIFRGEKLKVFLLKSGTRQERPFFTTPVQHGAGNSNQRS